MKVGGTNGENGASCLHSNQYQIETATETVFVSAWHRSAITSSGPQSTVVRISSSPA